MTGGWIILEFLCPWLGGVPGLLFDSLLSASLLRLSAWEGGGGRGLCGGGPGGVPLPLGLASGSLVGMGGRDGGPGSGISSFLELLLLCSTLGLLPGLKFLSATACAALVLSWIAWKFFLSVFSPGACKMEDGSPALSSGSGGASSSLPLYWNSFSSLSLAALCFFMRSRWSFNCIRTWNMVIHKSMIF